MRQKASNNKANNSVKPIAGVLTQFAEKLSDWCSGDSLRLAQRVCNEHSIEFAVNTVALATRCLVTLPVVFLLRSCAFGRYRGNYTVGVNEANIYHFPLEI